MKALQLAPQLTIARLKARTGDGWLDILAILSFMVGSAMAFTLAGGIHMFHLWTVEGADVGQDVNQVAEMIGEDFSSFIDIYFALSLFAGALLIIPIFSLGAHAARLGAQGRSERLASLRLVGITRWQTVVISLVETCVQWLIGTALGFLIYYFTLPLWHNVKFLDQPIYTPAMRLSVGQTLLVVALLLLTALASTVAGLSRVSISPLGVAKRTGRPPLRAWRLVLLFFSLGAFLILVMIIPSAQHVVGVYGTILTAAVSAGVVLAIIVTLNIAASYLLQLFALICTRTGNTTLLIAARRILDNPKMAWRSISALALLAFVAGFNTYQIYDEDTWSTILSADIRTGSAIILIFGFLVASLSTVMNQASHVFDRAEQTQSLGHIGVPFGLFTRVRFAESFVPLLIAVVLCAGVGRFLSSGFAITLDGLQVTDSLTELIITLALGLSLCLLAIYSVTPLERKVVLKQGRKND